ncbi:permease prefix domain 1-containing protein [Promicromonospora soli]
MSDSTVHRLLDEAFADVEMTPEIQDLKEEIRANLLDRVAELTTDGVAPDEAARRAIDELGDVRALVEEASGPAADAGSVAPATPSLAVSSAAAAAAERRRVPPSRRYVAGVVVASVVALLALAPLVTIVVFVVSAADRIRYDVIPAYVPLLLGGLPLSGPAIGWIVAASLVRETATNYGMPRRRAIAYGVASALLMIGLVAGVEVYILVGRVLAGFQTGVPLLVAGGAWLAYLLATQTNRHKPWVLELEREHAQAANRFDEDPAAAARFGIYTAVVWVLAFVVFLVLGFTVGWGWALLALVGGFVGMLLLLATMLFDAKHTRQE